MPEENTSPEQGAGESEKKQETVKEVHHHHYKKRGCFYSDDCQALGDDT